MSSISYTRFSGSSPRLAEHLVANGAAAYALDCRFHHGTLQSWREPKLVRNLAPNTTTVTRLGCCWVESDKCVDYAEGGPNCREVFRTGENDYPEIGIVDYEQCTIEWHRLGVPCADGAPSLVLGDQSGPEKDFEGRTYVYQYVNALGHKGAASKPSEVVLAKDGGSVTVSGWSVPDPSWGVTHVRIYRTVSGYQAPNEPKNEFDTTYMFVAEVPVTTPAYVDRAYNEDLVDALVEDVVEPPVANLRGVTSISGTNVLAGFSGNRLYFSANNEWHNWPHYLDLDDNICAIAEVNGTIYAATDGSPYAIQGQTDCEGAGCRNVVKFPVRYPMVGCGNRRMASTHFGAVYPTHDGLVGLRGNEMPTLLTTGLYAPDDWHKLIPQSITPVQHGGLLFVFGEGGSFAMKLSSGPERGWDLDSHTNLSDKAIDAFETRTGEFYIVKEGGLFQWDRSPVLRPHLWRSALSYVNVMTVFGAGRIAMRGGPEEVKVLGDDRTVLSREIFRDKVFRLPKWGACGQVQVELSGTAEVSLFALATSMKELTA